MTTKYKNASYFAKPIWFVKTREFREPKRGEYYLSGAIPEVYRAANDLGTKFDIMRPVPFKLKEDNKMISEMLKTMRMISIESIRIAGPDTAEGALAGTIAENTHPCTDPEKLQIMQEENDWLMAEIENERERRKT